MLGRKSEEEGEGDFWVLGEVVERGVGVCCG